MRFFNTPIIHELIFDISLEICIFFFRLTFSKLLSFYSSVMILYTILFSSASIWFNSLRNYRINSTISRSFFSRDTCITRRFCDRSAIYYSDTGRTLRDSRRFSGGACSRECPRFIIATYRGAFRHGCLPRGWSCVVINQKVDAKGALRVAGND